MKKTAILSSGGSPVTGSLVKMFNQGTRLRVELVLTDRENSGLPEELEGTGVEVVFLPREAWHSRGDEIMRLLDVHGIDIVAVDNLKGVVPPAVSEAYGGRMVVLGDEAEAPRQLVGMLQKDAGHSDRAASPAGQPPVGRPVPPPVPKSVDEEWAEALQVTFDTQTARERAEAAAVPPSVETPPAPGHPAIAGQADARPYFMRMDPGAAPVQSEPMPSTFLVWAVLATVFCCFIPGIVAVIFASQVSSRYAAGDLEGSRRASRNAEIWIIVSIVLGVISAGLYLPIMLL